MIESYRNYTIKGDFKILLRTFYVGLTMPHRQLLDFATKWNFTKIDPNIAYEIIEGVARISPPQTGLPHTQGGTQVFEKLCEVTFFCKNLLNPSKMSVGTSTA